MGDKGGQCGGSECNQYHVNRWLFHFAVFHQQVLHVSFTFDASLHHSVYFPEFVVPMLPDGSLLFYYLHIMFIIHTSNMMPRW